MKVYEVKIVKTCFIEAETKDEARELALDDAYIMCDERIDSVKVSSKKSIIQMMFS